MPNKKLASASPRSDRPFAGATPARPRPPHPNPPPGARTPWLRSAKWRIPPIHETSSQGVLRRESSRRPLRSPLPPPSLTRTLDFKKEFARTACDKRMRSPISQRFPALATALDSMCYAAFTAERLAPRFGFPLAIGILILPGRSLSSRSKLPSASQSSSTTESPPNRPQASPAPGWFKRPARGLLPAPETPQTPSIHEQVLSGSNPENPENPDKTPPGITSSIQST